ncbi:MAG: hypothetical protein N3B16_11925 [Candidatus Aminicenantes bacterium]|nr:hypothetical protein [Candidatus Aminicenantes bacterium]
MKIKAWFCFIAGWFIPGLGHLIQKKFWRGLIFFVCIGGMASLGLAMGGKIYSFRFDNPLMVLTVFADLGNSFLFILARLFPIGRGVLESPTFEFGTAYIAGAGLLNYLVALDAFDLAQGKKS